MVKRQKEDNTETRASKAQKEIAPEASIINANTHYETCSERLTPFGGVLALIKFLDLIGFKDIFEGCYHKPTRKPKLGHYRMVVGILMLLFIGFSRLAHFAYIRRDAILCGFLQVVRLPVVSTFWRYVDSVGINQAKSLLWVMAVLRERAWQQCKLSYELIHLDIDTTVETIYGNQQGGRKGHNPKARGKKGYRPVLGFIEETREYLSGKLRRGETLSGKECAVFIEQIKTLLPGCVKRVTVRADGEFLSWEAVKALRAAGFDFIIGNKVCKPVFDPHSWFRPRKTETIAYNSWMFQPQGWKEACRFVAMRMLKKEYGQSGGCAQLPLFEDELYTYRIFCTSHKGQAHKVIALYDKRADVENLIGESKREGLEAIPSSKFKNNRAWFQLVMLAFNIWRYTKMLANISEHREPEAKEGCEDAGVGFKGIVENTIRIARLKMLFIAAKIPAHSNTVKVRYSIHDSRTYAMLRFLAFLDKMRSKVGPWVEGSLWPCRFCLNPA